MLSKTFYISILQCVNSYLFTINLYLYCEIIKNSKDDEEALSNLNKEFGIDEIQGKAILDMQLRRLTGLSREKIVNELKELYEEIKDLKDILANHSRVIQIIKDELTIIKDKYASDNLLDVYIIPMDTEPVAIMLAEELRNINVNVMIEFNKRKVKKCFEYANKEQINYLLK